MCVCVCVLALYVTAYKHIDNTFMVYIKGGACTYGHADTYLHIQPTSQNLSCQITSSNSKYAVQS